MKVPDHVCLRLDLYICIIRHIHDPVLSSLKMEGIIFLTFSKFFPLNASAAVESETLVVSDARTE
jgi:hypothetical protein